MTKENVEAAARAALEDVLDPETGISIAHLGLVYAVRYDVETRFLCVVMTFTTPACPAGEMILEGVQRRLGRVDGVAFVDVDLVFEPRWTPARITAEGRAELGWPPSPAASP
ncbi:MAG: metal-sulfur cluster assembly factor [Deltaproteobacteria bacterium]|nr:metal-sulfur cluster assembly factor [Deltaproteobacteria bacterium]